MAKHRVKRYNGEDDSAVEIEDESDRGAMTPEQQASSNAQLASEKPKRAIVTKEQLAASGYDNLRDYLNAKQGLKRRDGSAPSKATPTTVTKEKTTVSTSPRVGRAGQAAASSRVGNKVTEEGLARMRAKDESFRNAPSPLDNIKSVAKKLREKAGITSYKKGGMATPSKRADGIARRGHTRYCGGGRTK